MFGSLFAFARIARIVGSEILGLASKREREVNAYVLRIRELSVDGNVVGLIHLLDSDVRGRGEYSIVRHHAAHALGLMGDPRAIPHLMELWDDPERIVQHTVMGALGRLKAKEAVGFLQEKLKDPLPLHRMTAATALGQIGEVDVIPALQSVLSSESVPYVRLHAVEALVILGDTPARARVPEVLNAVERKTRELPRYKRLKDAVESGQALTPSVLPWD